MKQIIITIQGGCVQDVEKPDDIEVIIKDYDIQDEEGPNIKQDDDGDFYQEIVFD
jgi:hypothetical protein